MPEKIKFISTHSHLNSDGKIDMTQESLKLKPISNADRIKNNVVSMSDIIKSDTEKETEKEEKKTGRGRPPKKEDN